MILTRQLFQNLAFIEDKVVNVPEAYKEKLIADFAGADKFMLITNILYWLFLSTLGGSTHGYYLLGYVGGGLGIALALIGYHYYRGSYICRILIGCSFCIVDALYIQQDLGSQVSHIAFFINLGFLLRYKDGLATASALVLVIIHHTGATYCDTQGITVAGMPILAFNWGTWDAYIVHITYSVVFIGILFVVTYSSSVEFRKNHDLITQLSDANETLEDTVLARTAETEKKNKDIESMFMYLPEGILTFKKDKLINDKYTLALETIFQSKDIAGKDVITAVIANTNISQAVQDKLEKALNACFGQHKELDYFNKNKDSFIEKVRKNYSEGRKSLVYSWRPIYDASDHITDIMLTIRDVTKLEDLQNESKRQYQELHMTGQLIAVEKQRNEFLTISHTWLDIIQQLNTLLQDDNSLDQNAFLTKLHSISDEAKHYSFTYLLDCTEEVSKEYEYYNNGRTDTGKNVLLKSLQHVSTCIEKYREISHDKLGWSLSTPSSDYSFVSESDTIKALNILENADSSNIHSLKEALTKVSVIINRAMEREVAS